MRNTTSSRAPRRRARVLEQLPGHPHALGRVVLVAPFADVVQQQREHQQLGRLEIPQQRREALAPASATSSSRSRFLMVSSVCSSTVYLW